MNIKFILLFLLIYCISVSGKAQEFALQQKENPYSITIPEANQTNNYYQKKPLTSLFLDFKYPSLITFNADIPLKKRKYSVSVTSQEKTQPAITDFLKRSLRYPLTFLDTYHNNYFLFYGYGGGQYSNLIKFQISIRFHLYLSGESQSDAGVYFAYSQKSFWDLWNFDASSPFIESNYAPEFFVKFNCDDYSWLPDHHFLQVGIIHESNGGSGIGIKSRGWNRIYGEIKVNHWNKSWAITPRVWYIFNEKKSDNPNIGDYLGYGEITFQINRFRKFSQKVFGLETCLESKVKILNKVSLNKTGIEIIAKIGPFYNFKSFGIIPIAAYIQYYRGYGESLLNYDKFNKGSLSFGLSTNLW